MQGVKDELVRLLLPVRRLVLRRDGGRAEGALLGSLLSVCCHLVGLSLRWPWHELRLWRLKEDLDLEECFVLLEVVIVQKLLGAEGLNRFREHNDPVTAERLRAVR